MIKAVIFDWGGVITPSLAGKPNAFRQRLAPILGTDEDSARLVLRQAGIVELLRGNITEEQFWHRIEQAHGAPITPVERARVMDLGELHPEPRMLKFIADLKHRGYRTALLSNASTSLRDLMHRHAIRDLFDALIISCDVHCVKPDDEIYQLALKRVGAAPGECLFVDDQQRMLDPAAALGMHTVLATGTDAVIKEIEDALKA